MTTEIGVKINAPDITSGTVIDVTAATNSGTFSGKMINIDAGAHANQGGTIVAITANSLTTGVILDITKHKLQGAGRAIKLSGGSGAERLHRTRAGRARRRGQRGSGRSERHQSPCLTKSQTGRASARRSMCSKVSTAT